MRRDLRQMSLADGLVHQRAGRNAWLVRLDQLIAWSAVALVLSPIYSSDEGRPSYPVLTLVKLLLLQPWYGLSDPGLEEAVDDRLSFRRFAGLPLDEGVPDHSTIWRFRQELERHGLSEPLFAEINRQLDVGGLIRRTGTLIDATIVAAAVKPPSGTDGTVSERDPQAGWTKKNGQQDSGLIRGAFVALCCPGPICTTAKPGRRWFKATRRRSTPTRPMTAGPLTAGPSAMRWPRPASWTV